ncbi:C-type mannose receptor 2 isoform X2 [Dicentrarchus labrax]|uniref:C-type mannose receptor 2 isoform X2 n=1 Tax=Dicentrarchus labrax TaxID=13489 RepID=UPI0021F65F94|nr:C-type mannose receptor 2 isoform X2 [Dicentrarchus labrax]
MMDRILLGVLYLSGWNIIPSCLLHQYHFVVDPMNWTEAQSYCRDTYTDLATIENTEEMNQLINTVSSAGHRSEVWIGLYSKIDWRWSDSYRGSGAQYKNWDNYNDNEPDFGSANQFCVCFGGDGGWWDDQCSIEYPFICYRGTQLDPEFVFVNKKMNWSNAQRHCRETFTDLVTVRNNTENQKIQSLLPFSSGNWVWIGFFRDPNMYWSDGSRSSFRYWRGGVNSIASMSVVCGAATLQSSGQWRFLPCGTKLPFVCYSAPPAPLMRQVVKLKIEDSSVDLNDPAVKADILKKFQDKLKEKRVNGVTLKWREQPDGKVFHKEKQRKKTEL